MLKDRPRRPFLPLSAQGASRQIGAGAMAERISAQHSEQALDIARYASCSAPFSRLLSRFENAERLGNRLA